MLVNSLPTINLTSSFLSISLIFFVVTYLPSRKTVTQSQISNNSSSLVRNEYYAFTLTAQIPNALV
jgi:hypothetical protein